MQQTGAAVKRWNEHFYDVLRGLLSLVGLVGKGPNVRLLVLDEKGSI
jgi:hypothetical protein